MNVRATLNRIGTAKILLDLGERTLHKAETLNELIHSSPSNSTRRKGKCNARFVGFMKRADQWHVTYRVTCGESYSDSRGHLVKFNFSPEVGISQAGDLEVEVSCSCPAFVYWGAQWNLKSRNSLERVYPILKAPQPAGVQFIDKKGNPRTHRVPRDYVVCKHIACATERMTSMLQKHIDEYTEEMV